MKTVVAQRSSSLNFLIGMSTAVAIHQRVVQIFVVQKS
jgi:hypothetical protein